VSFYSLRRMLVSSCSLSDGVPRILSLEACSLCSIGITSLEVALWAFQALNLVFGQNNFEIWVLRAIALARSPGLEDQHCTKGWVRQASL